MRAEDKELEGPELEHAQSLEELEVAKEGEEEELPVIGTGEQLVDLELAHRGRLVDAIELVLAGEQLNLSLLYLPKRETEALALLQAAVEGQDSMGEFVFAEDRRSLLEQALAVLQQNLTHGSSEELAQLESHLHVLTSRVAELRQELLDLEDAQEDIREFHVGGELAKPPKPEGEDDEAAAIDDDAEPGFVAAAVADWRERTTLLGDEPAQAPKPPSVYEPEPEPRG